MKPGASTATNGLAKAEIVLALALTAFSAVLHFHWRLNAGGLWRDEVGSVQFATMTSWGEIWKDLAFDNFPPLLLPFLRAWHGLGLAPDDSGWRNFGLGVGLLFLLLAWATSRFLLLRPPLLLLSVVGLSPLAVRTLDTLRPYGLGIVLMIAAFAAFYKTALNPSPRRTILAALCATLAVQTLYQNSVLILALFCGAVALAWRVKCARAAWHLLAASMVAAVSVLPHLGHLRASQDFGVIAQGPVDFRHLLAVTASALAESGPIPLWLFPATVLAALAWIIFPGRWPFSAATRPIAWFIIPVVLVGTTGFYLFLLASKLPTQPWYYVILLALAACAVDSMATLDAPVAFRWSRLGAAAVLALGAVPFSWPGSALRMTTVDLLAAKVTRGAVPEDLVLISAWEPGVTWQFYYRQGRAPWQTIPPLSDHRIHRYDLVKELMMQSDQSQVMSSTLQSIRNTLKSGHRVWLVGDLPVFPKLTPISLPPAPQGPDGWRQDAYAFVWSCQVGTFLQAHGHSMEMFKRSLNAPTNEFENLDLFRVTGWRE